MTRTLRNGAFGLGLLALSIGTAIAAPAASWTRNPLQVTMVPFTGQAAGEFLGAVTFSMTNTSNEPVRVLKWQTPFFGLENNLFDVHLGGEKVDYVGLYAKRGAPTDDDYMTLAPQQTQSVVIDLSENYEMERTGQYQIQYHAHLQGMQQGNRPLAKSTGAPVEIESFPMVVFVDGSDQIEEKVKKPLPSLDDVGVKAAGIAYERCTTTQESQLVTALNSARTYASNGASYFSHTYGPRYTTWFGSYTSSRYATGKSHFNNISSALSTQTVTINCGCKKSYYAYVYPNDPYRIYVCRAFWSAPNTGTDSRAGTLIHETSHFTVVAGTDDHVYGTSAAKSLAISNPDQALDNADNHEYFGENTPAQN